jgi:5-aminopentanamidase
MHPMLVGATMRVAACQLPYLCNDLPAALSLVESHAAEAERRKASVVCFPECFLQGYLISASHIRSTALDLNSIEFERILTRWKSVKPMIVVGLIERAGDRFYNSAAVIARGMLVATYRKIHLLEREQALFAPGSDHPTIAVDGTSFGINICYDLNFPEGAGTIADLGASVLVCPCNNMMEADAAERWKHRHNQIRSQRARETGLWIVSSDVSGEHAGRISYGPTAIIDPSGTVVEQIPLMTTGMVVADLS